MTAPKPQSTLETPRHRTPATPTHPPALHVVPPTALPPHRTALPGTVRAVVAALMGFVIVLGAGRWATATIGDADPFTGIALAAATVAVFAPLGALGGALVAAFRYRHRGLTLDERRLFGWAMVLAWSLSLAAYALTDMVAGLTVLILETAALVIVRIALVEGAARRVTRPRGRRPDRRLPVRPPR